MFCPRKVAGDTGQVERLTVDDDLFHVDSFFDVFVDIDLPVVQHEINELLKLHPCPVDWKLRVPELELEVDPDVVDPIGPVVLPGHTAWEIQVMAPEPATPEDIGAVVDVVVFAPGMVGAGPLQVNHVLVRVVRSRVEDLLNRPHLCCIRSVRMRVLLETVLAEALQAYLEEDCAKVMKLLRFFVQKAQLLMCDLDAAEKACLVKALRVAVDVARMVAIENGATREMIREGDFFRLHGLHQAAILEYGHACPPHVTKQSKDE